DYAFYVPSPSRLEAPEARALLKDCYGELPSVAPRWLRGLSYLLVFQQPGLQFRHPRLQSYKNTTFITRTIITKGGRGVTEHLTERAGERRRLRERNIRTGSHGGAKADAKLATPYQYWKNHVVAIVSDHRSEEQVKVSSCSGSLQDTERNVSSF
ncbi:hypothetical protein ILYODFUR_015798, partial [Ilyodon furcidens]